MGKSFVKLSSVFVVMILGILIMASCGGAPAPQTGAASTPTSTVNSSLPTQTVTIPDGQDLFVPFIVVIKAGQTVMWNNQNSSSYSVTTTPEKSSYLNPQPFQLSVPGYKSVTHTFTQPGLYHYYDAAKDTWNSSVSQIAANKGNHGYPLSMSGVIVVQGTISPRLPRSATVMVQKGIDLFLPYITAVRPGGTVTWKNYDSDDHTVAPVAGWSAPVNAQQLPVLLLPGSPKPGSKFSTTSIAFDIPGVYYYFCTMHATDNSTYNRAAAKTIADHYPIPMAGIVLVQ